MKHLRASCVGIALLLSSTAAIAQTSGEPTLQLNEKGYFEGPAVNVLAFSNWYDGLFADAKISGIEIIQQGMRSATNGDVGCDRCAGGAKGGRPDRRHRNDAALCRP
jgi:endoglucanase